jgi:uncharacterized protein (DUF2342 family)
MSSIPGNSTTRERLKERREKRLWNLFASCLGIDREKEKKRGDKKGTSAAVGTPSSEW